MAFFFIFSFNHIVLTKYHFVLGQVSFYFIALALITSNFQVPKRSLLFLALFLMYCTGSAAFFCYLGQGLCTSRPYTAVLSIVLVFLSVQYVAFLVQKNPSFTQSIEKYLVWGSWALVLLAVPDILSIARGGVGSYPPYDLEFLSPFGLPPYGYPRLRVFTQEPSYLGMVIATLYPICFIRLNEKFTLARTILVIGLWVCLVYSMSRTGLLACGFMTILILLSWPRRLLAILLAILLIAVIWYLLMSLGINMFLNFPWIPLFSNGAIEGSTLVRSAHVAASINAWISHPIFGVGLGQIGFLLPQFYPTWYGLGAPEYELWASKASFGGTPSLSFMPKMIAEIGLVGVGILIIWALPLIKSLMTQAKSASENRKYLYAFVGFLISSFGIEGYLFLPAWLIFGVIVGLHFRARTEASCH